MAKKNVWEQNFANIPRIREAVLEVLGPKLQEVRDNRLHLEERWLRYFRMWNVTHGEGHRYQGRAKLYVPEVRKNVESQARTFTHQAFPSDDIFEVSPGNAGTLSGALIQKSIRTWQLYQAKIRQNFHVYARQQCLYGTSPVRILWDKKTHHVFRKHMVLDKDGKRVFKPSREILESFNGPTFCTRDLFKWYSLNPRKPDFQDEGCVEYDIAEESELKLLEKKDELYGLAELIEMAGNVMNQDELQREVERMEEMDLHVDDAGYAGQASLKKDDKARGQFLRATVYINIVCPEACEDGEDKDQPIPMKIQIYNNQHVALVKRNELFHQKAPYVVGKYILPNADEFYGQGIPWAIEYMQHEINSKAEQAMDSVTLALNPIAMIDPAYASPMAEFQVEPGAVWMVNPQGVKLTNIPDVSTAGYNAIGILRQQIADFSDRTPNLPPQLQGKARSATQASIVGDIASVDTDAFIRQNEEMVLEPAMEMFEFLTDQNIDEDMVIMILGRRASDWKRKLIPKRATLGRYQYFWKASSQAKNRQILARQMIDAMKVAGSLPPEAQTQLKFNFAEAFKVLWTEGFQLPDGDKIMGLPEQFMEQDPEVEHKMLEIGIPIEVLPGDNDDQHLAAHSELLQELLKNKEKNKEKIMELLAHSVRHKKQAEAKKALIEMRQQQQMMMQQAQMQAMAQGGAKAPSQQGGGMQGSGNRTQLSPNSSPGDMGSGMRA